MSKVSRAKANGKAGRKVVRQAEPVISPAQAGLVDRIEDVVQPMISAMDSLGGGYELHPGTGKYLTPDQAARYLVLVADMVAAADAAWDIASDARTRKAEAEKAAGQEGGVS